MISVIIIAYNAERTIERCIKSVVSQSYNDFELIIIDDGSTDKTIDIITHYANIDKRIIKRSRHNLGVAVSRQEGLDLATGDYTIFVDADDWVEANYLEMLLNEVRKTNSDMVVCDMKIEWNNRTEYSSQKPKDLNPAIILGQMLYELHGSLCNKLISRSAYERTGVRFLPNLDCCEDQYVVIALLSNNISVSYVNQALYHYDKTANNDSLSNNWLNIDVKKRVYFIKNIAPFIKTKFQNQCYNNYIGRLAYTSVSLSKSACPNYKDVFNEFLPQIRVANIPKYKKIICYLCMNGVKLPIRWVKLVRLYIRNKHNNIKNEK